jgi:oligoribonuclease
MAERSNSLIWIDCEMTGLRVEEDVLLEIAVILTDDSLQHLVAGPNLVIHQSASQLDKMNEWCKRQFGWTSEADHDADNLAGKSLRSTVTVEAAEEEILKFIRQYNVVEKKGVLAGNSVHMDKRFIDKYMPRLSAYMHYRIIDVSTIKELCARWNPEIAKHAPIKKATHRALDDIVESINELKFYQQHFFT